MKKEITIKMFELIMSGIFLIICNQGKNESISYNDFVNKYLEFINKIS